ncbi:hypothetical protein B0H14DRAFT_2863962 [Mycena olivaceomarginata]|nr:hypothetical protein B0H14DRAFT_2863962 [Mycena olivaceomarginata]
MSTNPSLLWLQMYPKVDGGHEETEARLPELESGLELGACKRAILGYDASIRRREAENGHVQGESKARGVDHSVEIEERYREIAKRNKALISNLKDPLSRLTSELSSHHRCLAELRTLHDKDSRTLKEKSVEIQGLRQAVGSLACAVEELRGLVEESLRVRHTPGPTAMLCASKLKPECAQGEKEEEAAVDAHNPVAESDQSDGAQPLGDEAHAIWSTHTTAFNPVTRGRFLGEAELARIAADVEARRRELLTDPPTSHWRSPALPSRQHQSGRATVDDVSDSSRAGHLTRPRSRRARDPAPVAPRFDRRSWTLDCSKCRSNVSSLLAKGCRHTTEQ